MNTVCVRNCVTKRYYSLNLIRNLMQGLSGFG